VIFFRKFHEFMIFFLFYFYKFHGWVLQRCLTLPSSHQILSSFGLYQLLSIRSSTRIAITGIPFHTVKSIDERLAEKEERDHLSAFHDLLVQATVENFCLKFRFLTKIFIFWLKFRFLLKLDFWVNFWFLAKILIFG